MIRAANINVTLYDGEFQVGFDCAGVTSCQFALCQTMPPTGDDDCTFREHGSCRRTAAQQAVLTDMLNRIKKEMKRLENED